EYSALSVNVTISKQLGKVGENFFTITQQMAEDMVNTGKTYTVTFPISSEGRDAYSACMPGKIMRVIRFCIQYEGIFSIVVSTLQENRMRYMQEFRKTADGTNECVQLWQGMAFGNQRINGRKNGVVVRINGSNGLERVFSFISDEREIDIPATFTAICPENCHESTGNGVCSLYDMKCNCNASFGGVDCHKLCYYNGAFLDGVGNNQCYQGTDGCDDYCKCKDGYTLTGHLCASTTCSSRNFDSLKKECDPKSEGCQANCQCDAQFFTYKRGICYPNNCGNGIVESVVSSSGVLRLEDCDNGLYCDSTCHCMSGYVQDKSNTTQCIQENNPAGMIVGIVVGCVVAFSIFIACLIAFLVYTYNFGRIDIMEFKKQQEPYYFYLSGSVSKEPSRENKYLIEPLALDFGNSSSLTAVADTRYERIEISNKSRKKWMMVIFHTPNNPKFVFHFDPLVLLVRPNHTTTITVYATINCTCKIKDMKINYTVWFSNNKTNLEDVRDLLKGKDFESWSRLDQLAMDKKMKGIISHYHYSFVIKTEVATSTLLDMDELNMRD
ncbi:protein kinase domain containing protein, partial [Entamoeba invadens IP1]